MRSATVIGAMIGSFLYFFISSMMGEAPGRAAIIAVFSCVMTIILFAALDIVNDRSAKPQ